MFPIFSNQPLQRRARQREGDASRGIAGSEQAIRAPNWSTSDKHVDIHPILLEIRFGNADFTTL